MHMVTHQLFGFEVSLATIEVRDGRKRISYSVKTPPFGYEKLDAEFVGDDFGLPDFRSGEDFWAAIDLLSFITLQPSDGDPEFLEDYTPDQLAWANSPECEYAQTIVSWLLEQDGEWFVPLHDARSARQDGGRILVYNSEDTLVYPYSADFERADGGAAFAVIAAHAICRGDMDWETWEDRYAQDVRVGEQTVVCGKWAAATLRNPNHETEGE